MKTYTIQQIRTYILSQDSLGDVLYNLNEENIDKANLFTDELVEPTKDDYDENHLCMGDDDKS